MSINMKNWWIRVLSLIIFFMIIAVLAGLNVQNDKLNKQNEQIAIIAQNLTEIKNNLEVLKNGETSNSIETSVRINDLVRKVADLENSLDELRRNQSEAKNAPPSIILRPYA